MTLIVLIGMPAAGKTTFAKQLAGFTGTEIVSRDDISYSPEQRWAWLDLIDGHLREQKNVIADSTGSSAKTRSLLRALAGRHRVPCIAVAFEDVNGARIRNRLRPVPVPEEAMERLRLDLRLAFRRLSEEGFDRLLWS